METEVVKVQENKMGTMPVNRLLLTMSAPMMVSMLVQALYNIVDSIFVARITEDAFTAVSLVFPMQTIMIAVASGTGIGVNALLSKRLGEKRFEEASRTANISMVIAFCEYLVFLLIGVFASEFFFAVQTDNTDIIAYGKTYMSICLIMSFGLFGQFCFEKLLQSTGRTFYTMITQASGAVINIIMDPILIFGLFGFPKMGIAGAAVATVAGQIFAMLLALLFNLRVNRDIRLKLSYMKPRADIVKEIFIVGIPSILMQSIGSVMVFLFNKILLGFSTTAVAVFGAYFKLQSFVFMPVFGLNNGVIPIVAYNYGAGHKERILKTMRLGMTYAIGIMAVGMLLVELIPGPMLLLFDADERMLELGIPAFRIICTCFMFAGFSIVASGTFQALGKSIYSLAVSVIRQLVVLIPVAYLLSLTGRLELVWLSFPIAEIFSVLITVVMLRHMKKFLNEIFPE